MYMRKIIIGIICFLICGCAHTPHKGTERARPGDTFVEVNDFCRAHGLSPQFDTIDDMVKMESKEKDIRLLLNSLIAYVNGTTFYLKYPPYYRDGRLFIPAELADIAFGRKIVRRREAPVRVKTIVIDPGHGGKDPGAISPFRGIKEKDLNLSFSRVLKKVLEQKGYKVYMTRSTDIFLSLQQRTEIAKEKNADLFISIHANANRSRKVNGVEVYYLTPKYFNNEARSKSLAEKAELNFEGYFSHNTRAIVWDMICAENNAVSLEFASLLTRQLKQFGLKTRPPRGASFYVLKNAYVPSILLEMGYLTNKYDEKLLTSAQYQKQLMEAFSLCIGSYNSNARQFVKDYDSSE